MKKKFQPLIIASVIFCAVLLTLIAGCITESPPRLCISQFEYYIKIQTDEPITNVTLYLPLPVKNGVPMVGAMELENGPFEKDNFTIDFVQSPPGLDLNGTYPVRNNQPWFLKISTDRIDPDPSGRAENFSSAEYFIEIRNSTEAFTPASFANILYPVGNESVLLPKSKFTQPSRVIIPSRSPEWVEYAPVQTSQELPVYANYLASPTSRVKIYSEVRGYNIWTEPSAIRGVPVDTDGGGNEFVDRYSWTWYGDSHGWHDVSGEFLLQRGVYPNLDHPIWQKMMHQT